MLGLLGTRWLRAHRRSGAVCALFLFLDAGLKGFGTMCVCVPMCVPVCALFLFLDAGLKGFGTHISKALAILTSKCNTNANFSECVRSVPHHLLPRSL